MKPIQSYSSSSKSPAALLSSVPVPLLARHGCERQLSPPAPSPLPPPPRKAAASLTTTAGASAEGTSLTRAAGTCSQLRRGEGTLARLGRRP